MKHELVCIVGRTAAGKSIIAKKLAERLGLSVVKSYKTGKPTPEDVKNGLENADHIFITDEEFDKLEDIAAKTEINGVRYCTTVDQLEQNDFYVIDPIGVKELREKYGKKFHITEFYIYAEEDIRKKRYVKYRGQTEDEFYTRNTAENAQFSRYESEDDWNIIIFNNDDVEEAVDTMEEYVSIILKHRIKEKSLSEPAVSENAEATSASLNENESEVVESAVEPVEGPVTESVGYTDVTEKKEETSETDAYQKIKFDSDLSLDDEEDEEMEAVLID